MNADPRVMEFFAAPLSPAESDAMVLRIEAHFARHGFGFFAAELRATGEFIGFTGMSHVPFAAHFTPCVEIGWRLATAYWNQGFATEGARACLRYAFEELALPEVVAFTVPANQRSRRVMEKLGMARDPADDFEHPRLPEGHPLRRHVLYRATLLQSHL
jgi:RimJ/RimL family protein N-acetyltransferase